MTGREVLNRQFVRGAKDERGRYGIAIAARRCRRLRIHPRKRENGANDAWLESAEQDLRIAREQNFVQAAGDGPPWHDNCDHFGQVTATTSLRPLTACGDVTKLITPPFQEFKISSRFAA